MDTGPFFCGTFGHPGGPTLKGLAIKLGDNGQASICYDTELLRVSCAWTGGFLKFNPARFGLISAPVIAGMTHFHTGIRPGVSPTESFADPRSKPTYGPLPRDFARYQGLSLHDQRIALHYTIGQAEILESPWVEGAATAFVFTRELQISKCAHPIRIVLSDADANADLIGPDAGAVIQGTSGKNLTLLIPAHAEKIQLKVAIWSADPKQQDELQKWVAKSPACIDVNKLIQPGASGRWCEPVITKGVVSDKTDPYVLDTLTIPFVNRYNALMFLSGHDFFENGDAAVCTAHGDVWRVSGIDDKLERIKWKRCATGLFQPLGLKIVKRDGREIVHVLGRDQITALHDFDDDGEADFYHNFNNDGQITTNAHEFATCLETDSKGNFYYLRGDSGSQTAHDGCLLRVSPDGRKLDVFATGIRNGNGLSVGPDDTITIAPQEGNWTPGSAIFQVRQGGFYGAMQSHHRAIPPTTFDQPICWLPRLQDNSSGGQAWVTSDRWGPLQGQLLHFSFGTCRMFLTLRETLDDGVQGGTIQFPLLFDSGVMRGRFRPQDGQLYVTGLKGWVSSAVQDGCFQRVRYTGRPVDLPVKMETYSNGVALTFTESLDRESAEDPQNYGVEEWNYLWSGNYGSPDFRVSAPGQVGHDEVEVVSATLLSDDRTVFLELPDLKPAMQVGISYTLAAKAGRPIQQTYFATLHKLGAVPQPAELTRKERPGALPHEVEARLQSGLVLKIETSSKSTPTAWGVSRLAAYYVSAQQMIEIAGPDAAVTATWTGYIKVPQKGNYVFRMATGTAKLQIGDENIALDQPVTLRRGYQPLALTVKNQGATLAARLMWKAPNLPWEAVPPTQLFHLPEHSELQQAQTLHAGGDLFRERGCANCHAGMRLKGEAPPNGEWHLKAPALDQLGERLNPGWVSAWILDPRQLRKEATMPRLLHGMDKAPDRQVVADITSFLVSVSQKPAAEAELDASAESIDAGLQLYESLGCIGCHRFTEPAIADTFQRVSLYFVAAKFRPGRLAEFLRNPRQHAAQIRMPDFRLSPTESSALEAYLRTMSQGAIIAPPESSMADPQRGQSSFQTMGCQHCHQKLLKNTAEVLAMPLLDGLWGNSKTTGCLLANPPAGVPQYELTEVERAAIHQFLSATKSVPVPHFDIEKPQREMRRLNCQACHSRDGQNSPLAELLAEEGQGLPPEMLPQLTWAGEKLKTDWIGRLLHGKLAYKTRPWLKARMPSFPENDLATGLASEHGIAFDVHPPSLHSKLEAVEVGKQLTQKGQGLDCRQCHGVGQAGPSGDKSTLISVGINFSHVADRLNPEFFPRIMLNPPRYDPNSRMPVFAVDGKTTAAKDILEGDAERQFEMIWEYLRELK